MKLFGGAITADIPAVLSDAADFRQIPDNQEVFVGVISKFNTSLIIELLEAVDHPNITDALVVHINEAHRLSGTSLGEKEEMLQVEVSEVGKHTMATRIDIVNTESGRATVVFGLIRLEEYRTDVLVTSIVQQDGNAADLPEKILSSQTQYVFQLARSFEIIDPKLFVDSPHEHKAANHPIEDLE